MALRAEGFHVDTFDRAQNALDHLRGHTPDIIVSDIKMPAMDGIAFLKTVRHSHTIPFILLTSKDDEIDQLLGLRFGADDYITKPFSQTLLLERIRAILRRVKDYDESETNGDVENDTYDDGLLILDYGAQSVAWRGQTLDTSVTEFHLMKALTDRPGNVKSRDQLIDLAYGETVNVDDRTVDSHIKRLRKKFKTIDPDFAHIETVYGAGYKYTGGQSS